MNECIGQTRQRNVRGRLQAGVSSLMAALMIALVLASCTESELSEEATSGFALIVERAGEIIAESPPLCEALRSEGYETRKITFDEATDTALELAENACPDEIDRLSAARDVEDAAAMIEVDDIEVSFTNCAATATGFTATASFVNNSTVPVGIYAAVQAEVDQVLSGRPEFVVVWKLEPGATATRDVEGDASGNGCGAEYHVFLADDTLTGDASNGPPASPEIASDDPAVFYPALYEAEVVWWTDPDANVDGPSTTEDLRSIVYDDLYLSVSEQADRPPLPTAQGLCSASAHPDNPDIMILRIQTSAGLAVGVVRRGADRGWRWLGSTANFGAGPCP